jgi:hypothetical protein
MYYVHYATIMTVIMIWLNVKLILNDLSHITLWLVIFKENNNKKKYSKLLVYDTLFTQLFILQHQSINL